MGWRLFVMAKEDHRGVLAVDQLDQVSRRARDSSGDGDEISVALNYHRGASDLEFTVNEVLQGIDPGAHDITFKALKEFVVRQHNASCMSRASALKSIGGTR